MPNQLGMFARRHRLNLLDRFVVQLRQVGSKDFANIELVGDQLLSEGIRLKAKHIGSLDLQ